MGALATAIWERTGGDARLAGKERYSFKKSHGTASYPSFEQPAIRKYEKMKRQ